MTTADRFAHFAKAAASGGSPLYADWAEGMAGDSGAVAVVERARASQRQPVLVFAAARILGAPLGEFAGFRRWLVTHADDLVAELDRRHTQTNDVRRAGPLAVALAQVPGPIALVEVGASAGLCLYPDRYDVRIRQAGHTIQLGDPSSAVSIEVEVGGRDLPVDGSSVLPEIAWRGGSDLAPLDVRDDADVGWLETLLWPGQDERIALLRSAAAVAGRDPARIRVGDAVESLGAVVATVPKHLTCVVVATGTLVYLAGPRRQAFVDRVGELGVRWITYEKTGALEGVHATLPASVEGQDAFATLALDGRALAVGNAHGTTLIGL